MIEIMRKLNKKWKFLKKKNKKHWHYFCQYDEKHGDDTINYNKTNTTWNDNKQFVTSIERANSYDARYEKKNKQFMITESSKNLTNRIKINCEKIVKMSLLLNDDVEMVITSSKIKKSMKKNSKWTAYICLLAEIKRKAFIIYVIEIKTKKWWWIHNVLKKLKKRISKFILIWKSSGFRGSNELSTKKWTKRRFALK